MDLSALRPTRSEVYRDGDWHPAHGTATTTVVAPGTGEPVGAAPVGDAVDVDRAVGSAREAFDHGPWRSASTGERADVLLRLADAILARETELATVAALEIGQPYEFARLRNVAGPVRQLRYYAELVRERPDEEVRPASNWPGTTVVRREPVGVAALVVPWNYPQSLTMTKLAPALAAGCTVVIKPAEQAVLDAYQLLEACHDAGLPPGVVNLLPGDADTGRALVAHPGVDKVAFTGSTRAGREIAAACAPLFRPVTLELGGKSAAVVLADADLDVLVEQLARTTFANTGQTCFAQSRVLVPAGRVEEVAAALVDRVQGYRLGDPFDPATTMGPLVSSAQRERVDGMVRRAVADGARVATGGGRPGDLPGGWFFEPTVLVGVDNRWEIAQEEVFGPVAGVIPYDSEDEAVALANDSVYGLGGSVYTADPEHGLEVARRIVSGTVGINGYGPDQGAPFGGVKQSGVGKEYGPEGLAAYESVKSIFRPSA
jgi:acyl-CoA reductase-like NAD-dependent aldehyde dehydrogenase